MTTEEFEKVYELNHQRALSAARRVVRQPADAEDALQAAVIYCLENLWRLTEITPSYFIQLVVNRARDITRATQRREGRFTPAGHTQNLADLEERLQEQELGRKKPHPGAQ